MSRLEPVSLELTQIAPEREAQSGTDFPHTQRTQLRNPSAQSILRNGDRIVQVYCTRRFHAIFFAQDYLGGYVADRGRYGSNGDSREISDSAVAGQDEHGALLVWRSELVESDVTSGYSAGHAASASQPRDSSLTWGRLE
jgi:hypothetical protein